MRYENEYDGKLRKVYNDLALNDGMESHNISHWFTEKTQVTNFKMVANVMEEGESVLDVGCGLGDLRLYLPENVRYTGIDYAENVIKLSLSRNPDLRLIVGDILDYKFDEKFDAVVCCGAFNLGYSSDKVYLALKKMEELARKIVILTISYADDNDKKKFVEMGYKIRELRANFGGYGDDIVIYKYL